MSAPPSSEDLSATADSDATVNAILLTLSLEPVPACRRDTRAAKAERKEHRRQMRARWGLEDPEEASQEPKPKPKKEPKSKALRVRAGRLANLLDMPIDIFFEVVARLHPLDLLRLSRASKQFRSMIFSTGSRHMWKAAFKNVPGQLPPCPSYISEPRYAAVLFDQHCFACGIERSTNIEYTLSIRLCGPCYKTNFRVGTTIHANLFGIPEHKLRMLPTLMVAAVGGHYLTVPKPDSRSNDMSRTFYVSEFRAMVEELRAMKTSSEEEKAFIRARLKFASRMQAHGLAVEEWRLNELKEKKKVGNDARIDRETAILDNLKQLGYTDADYPDNDAWRKIFNQPTRLSDRIWKNIRPKLVALIEQEVSDRVKAAFKTRVKERREEMKPLYAAFLDAHLADEERSFAPNWRDATRFPSLTDLASSNDAYGPVTEEAFAAKADLLVPEIREWNLQAKRDLMEMLEREHQERTDERPTTDAQHTPEEVDSKLASASSLFICHRCDLDRPVSAAEICTHWRTDHPTVKWNDNWPLSCILGDMDHPSMPQSWVCALWEGASCARKAFAALALPEDVSYAELDSKVREGRLVCLCGSPELPPLGELTWGGLVKHVIKEQEMYSRRGSRSAEGSTPGVVFIDNHTLSGPTPCLKLLAEGEEVDYPDYELDEDTRAEIEEIVAANRRGPTCVVCEGMATKRRFRLIGFDFFVWPMKKDVRVIAHHMKTRHDTQLTKSLIRYDSTIL